MSVRRVYKAEWAAEANTLALRIDRALAPLDGGATLPQADALPQDSPSNPAPDRVVAFLDDALALDSTTAAGTATIRPDQAQAVINSTGTLTNKLRNLTTLANLQWRHTRGHKKHMRNGDIRAVLAPLSPLTFSHNSPSTPPC